MKELMERLIGRKSGLRRKAILLYFLGAVLPILIITVIISVIYYDNILENAYSLVDQNERQHEIIVNSRLDNFDDVLYELAADSGYIRLAKDINEGDEDESLVAEQQMRQMLQNSIYTYSEIKSIIFIADSGDYVSYAKGYGSTYDSVWASEEKRLEIRDQIEQKLTISFIAPVNLRDEHIGKDYVILLGIPVRDLRTKERSGVFIVALGYDMVLLEDSGGDWQTNSVQTVIVDGEDRILAARDDSYIDRPLGEFLEGYYPGPERISQRRRVIGDTGWEIVNIINLAVYQREISAMMGMVVLLILVITCIFYLLVYVITRKYILNIQKIAEGIQSYEGTPSQQIDVQVDEKDELYQIVRQFHKMTDRINSLVEALQKKNEDIREASIHQKHAEIKALEAQINPHFLYNTLDSINWRAIEHDEEEISNMLGTLASLLRYSVSNIDMVVMMGAEISWLEKYIFLQRDRFHDSFDCVYDIAEGVMEFPIYKMLLQPIVENAILHAFEEVESGGVIGIRSFVREDDRLEIHIRDNGSGMTQETLEEIRREIREEKAPDSKSIGISNVISRLRIYYGDEAQMMVNSELGQGTEFILIVPRAASGGLY